MKKALKLIILAAVIVLVLVGSVFLYNKFSKKINTAPDENTTAVSQQTETATQNALHSANDFTVTDADGKQVNLSSMKGKVTVVNFWATWCGYCTEEMPSFQKAFEKYGDKINFMMVNLTSSDGESKKLADSYVEENEFTFPVYFDTLNSVSLAYNVRSVPITYFIDAQGNIAQMKMGMMSESKLNSILEKLV